MKLNLHLGKYFGIPVNVHWSFIFLPLITIYWAITKGADTSTILLLLGLVLLIFFCVVLHEFGHALMAKKYGIKTKDIILLPICGMARLERLPERPIHELLVAAAGPMVNLFLALMIAIPLFFLPSVPTSVIGELSNARITVTSIPFLLVAFNLAMVVFNLFPIFPMDGGRILRSLLAMKLEQNNATRWASHVGQFFSVLIVLFGLYIGDYLLSMTGIFIFLLATREQSIVRHNDYMATTPMTSMISTDFTLLFKNDLLPLVKNQIMNQMEGENFFLVVDEQENICGYVSRAAIDLAHNDSILESILSYIPINLEYNMTLAEVTEIYRKHRTPILPVMNNGQLFGVVEFV